MGDSKSPDSGSRDPRLAGFVSGGCYDRALPSATVAGVLETVTDASGRPPDEATDDEVVGMLGCWQALEAHAHGRMLAGMRELIRRRAKAGFGDYPGDLPGSWEDGAAHEAAMELGISWQTAAPLLLLAWELQARLPHVGRLLDEGVLTGFKAKIVADEFAVLDDEKAAEAERLLVENDLGAEEMIPGKLRRLCQGIADGVDPEGAQRRREETQREQARVAFFRAHGGDTRMFASGLPADDALMAKANIQARALEYRNARIYPDAKMDLLRVLGMLDLINEVPVEARVARYWERDAAGDETRRQEQRALDEEAAETLARYRTGTRPASEPGRDGDPPESDPPGDEPLDGDGWDGPDDDRLRDDGHDPEDGDGPGAGPNASGPRSPGGAFGRPRDPGLPSLIHLTLPLSTLMGFGDRPGEVPGYGSIDPGLVRDLAAAASKSLRTTYCFSVTDPRGRAVGHACARLIRGTGDPAEAGLAPRTGWNLTPDASRAGPDDGYGSWILTVPGGARFRLEVHPVPVDSCDHRFATDAYRPGKLLRHLVEVRDGECSFPGCSQPAGQSDFEHGIPWDQGGVTDACNGAPRSRRCHQVKQSRNWQVSQPAPGRHVWRTPSGRTYEKGAKRYPS